LASLYRSLENGSRQKTLWRTLRKSALPRVLPFGIALFEILGIGSSGSLMEWITCCQL
jgi:hypothetical protein